MAATVIAVVAVPGFPALRTRLERGVERALFPGRRAAVARLNEAAGALARVRDARSVASLLQHAIATRCSPLHQSLRFGAPGEPLRDPSSPGTPPLAPGHPSP